MLTLTNVVAGYGGGDVLQGVDLHLDEGAIGCIVGPNGAGKSTVLKTISGLLAPRTGTVTLDGTTISGSSPGDVLRAGVSQVPQANALFPNMSVRENVLLGGWIIRKERARISARMSELEEIFPIVRERGSETAGNLSGGQRRMVEFARALMLEPRLVLLDEPSLGLDPAAMRLVHASVMRMRDAGTTVLLVEQQVKFGLGIATDAIVMEGGRVVMTGEASVVLQDPEMASLYFGGPSPASEEGRPGEVASPTPRVREKEVRHA